MSRLRNHLFRSMREAQSQGNLLEIRNPGLLRLRLAMTGNVPCRHLLSIVCAALLLGCGGKHKEAQRAAQSPQIAEQVGDVALLHLDAPAFDGLTPDMKRAAYYLSQAILAGRDIPYNQIILRSVEIRTFLEKIRLNATYAAPEYYVEPFEDYLKIVWIHSGFYDLTIGRKLKPAFGGRELGQLMFLALANSGGQLGSLLDINLKYTYIIDTLFNQSLDSTFLHPNDAASHDPNLDFPQGFYGGVTTAEAVTFPAKYPFNSRLIKRTDGLREVVYRTGDEELAPGLFAPALEKVVSNLENARPYLPPNRIKAADLLIQHLRTGRPSAFDSAAAIWRSSSAPLDFILGFADTRFDPLGNKGLWTGLLFVPDDVAQARLDRLREMAGDLLAELPGGVAAWLESGELKAAQLLAAIGANGPLCPDVYRDPPYAKMDSPRQSIIFTNVLVARARAESALEFYSSSADSFRAVQYAGEIAFVEAALREVLVVKNDQFRPDWRSLPDKPPGILAAVQSELVLLWLLHEPRLISVGLMPDAASQDEAYRRFARQFLSERAQMDLDRGQQARRVIGNFLMASGTLNFEKANGRAFCQLVSGDIMRSRVMELLQRIQELNRERDRRAASEFIENYLRLPDNLLPDQSGTHARERDRREAIARVAFILPLIEADFNPMGGLEDVQLKQPAGFAEEMFLFGGHELKKEKQ